MPTTKSHALADTIHEGAYVGATAPTDASVGITGAIRADVLWVDTSTTPPTLKRATSATAGVGTWAAVGPVIGTGATDAAAGNHSHAHSALTGIDTDSAPTAIHHTLGTGANQAAAGSHSHTPVSVEEFGIVFNNSGEVSLHNDGTIVTKRYA